MHRFSSTDRRAIARTQRILTGVCLPALGLSVAALPAAAAATDVPGDTQDLALAEIIVTAQKRAENLQQVPIAISTFSAAALENKGLSNVTDLAAFAPNVQLDNTSPFAGSSQILAASIRGIGQDDFAINLEPGVGLYIDGVYYARSLGAVADLLDLDHIEILKGPQGTLFGRNTIGGALNVVTRDPANKFGYQAEITHGSYNRTNVRASVDVPLVEDKLLAQVSVSSKNADGWQKRVPYPGASGFTTDGGKFNAPEPSGGSSTQGGENAQNLRVKLLWHASDSVTVHISGDYTHVDENAVPWTLLNTSGGPTGGTVASVYNACVTLPTATLSAIGLGAVCGPRAVVGTALAGGPARLPVSNAFITGNPDTSYANGYNFDKEEAGGASVTVDWKPWDRVNLKSISAYRKLDSSFGADVAATPFVISDSSFRMWQHQFSQEEQFSFDSFDKRLKNLFGLYYFHEAGTLIDYPVFLEGLLQIYSRNLVANDSYAAFAHEHFDITDKLGFTFGLRYTNDHKRFQGGQHELNEFAIKTGYPTTGYPDPNDLTRLYPLGWNAKTFTNLSSKVGLEYKIDPDLMIYASFSQGFKDGGWTSRLLAPARGNIAPSFGPEKAKTYEVGLKSELFGRRVRSNLAVFDTNYDQIQETVIQGISPVFENAGSATIRGFESETEARMTSNFILTANIGFLDAYYTKIAPGALITKEDRLVNTPRWSLTVGGSFNIDFPNNSALTLETDFNHKTNIARDAVNVSGDPYLWSGNINQLSASATYMSASGNWSVTAGGHNITNNRFLVTGYDQMSSGQLGFVAGVYSPPAMWYLTFKVKQ